MDGFCLSCAVYLDLLLVKHAQPLQVDHIGQTLPEGQAVRPDLLVQSVVGHQMDVGYPVCCGHRNVFASKLQLNHLGQKGTKHLQISYTVLDAVFHNCVYVLVLIKYDRLCHTAYFIMHITALGAR